MVVVLAIVASLIDFEGVPELVDLLYFDVISTDAPCITVEWFHAEDTEQPVVHTDVCYYVARLHN